MDDIDLDEGKGPDAPARAGRATRASAMSAPNKRIMTMRLDGATLDWFKMQGPGYQTRINQLLREYVEAQQAKLQETAS